MTHIRHLILPAALLAAGFAGPAAAADPSGQALFAHYCAPCHGDSNGPGTQQLRRSRGADKALLVERTDLAADYIQYIVRHGLKAMPPFVPSDLTDAKLRTLVSFLTSPLPRTAKDQSTLPPP